MRSIAPKTAIPPGGFIPLVPGLKEAGAAKPKGVSPEDYWLDFYKKHDESPQDLKDKVTLFNFYKKFRDVRAVLFAYLKNHPKSAEPWMYEAYSLSLKMTQGKEADVKTSLGYAADLAIKSRNPNNLVSVADQMLLLGYLDRVGPLLDQSYEQIPHRAEPLIMSINLAQRTRDPKRMADSFEKLLSLGWPGIDEALRREARKQVDALAKALREEGRGAEADALLARVPGAEARDLFARLTWVGDAGLDLAVEEPLGATARVLTPRTVFGGAIVKDGYGSHPEEVYVCPRGFDGDYTFRVETTYNNPEKPALQATLEVITHEGTSQEHKESHTIRLGGSKPPEPVKVTLKGGRRTQAMPFLAPTAPAPPPSLAGPAAGSRPGAATSSPRSETKGREPATGKR